MAARLPGRRPLSADERAQVEALVRDFAPRLAAYVRYGHGRQVDAEEVVAETFCRALGNVARLLRCDRPELYLLTIARNLCRDQQRRRRVPAVIETGREADAREPAAELAEAERRTLLRAAVARLPQVQREVVVLRLSTGLKFEQIAELLGVPLGTVLSRMHAALVTLREQLAVRL